MLTDEQPFPVAVAVDEPGYFWMTGDGPDASNTGSPPTGSPKRRRAGMVPIAAGSS